MPGVEITEQEAKILGGAKALQDRLLGSPKTKRAYEALVKELYPDTVTTDDIAEPYVKEIKELRKEFTEYVKNSKGKELDSRLDRDIAMLKTDRDFTDEGIEKLKKLMVDKEIPDIVVAADHWERQNPPKAQEPSLISPTDWGFGRQTEDPDLKLLFQDEDAWAEREATKAWNEESKKRGQIIT